MAANTPVQNWARTSPDSLALTTPNYSLTWLQLQSRIDHLSIQLDQQGITQGDVVTCIGRNSDQLLLLYLACIQSGVICAFSMPEPQQKLADKLERLYSSSHDALIWSTGDMSSFDVVTSERLVKLDFASSDEISDDSRLSPVAFSPQQLCSIVFTSGSTGAPKAVAHQFTQHQASAQGLLEQFQFIQGDTWLLSLPMYHVSGLAIVHRWLSVGACLKVGIGDLAQDIQGVSHASLVAAQLTRLLADNQPLSLSHVLLGGSHVDLSLSQDAAKRGIETWFGYGMTEAASTVTAKRIDANYSAGKTLPQRQLEIRNGRIWVGGETIASGYFQQGKLEPILDSEGWFDTKDLGRWSAQDELIIVGRADNQFISGGENIHCEEIEQVLAQHPNVSQVIVVPVENEEYGARPVALISGEADLELNDIDAWLKDKLVRFKQPDAYLKLPQHLLAGGIKLSRRDVKHWLAENTVWVPL
ncbi:o-succinylbenzoate--CoA ligase [Vibrio sp. LaRot3]|uniref:o-succinylbenzoate--CoA ligase n=1 Tax=Vibrio sp. LaRot3 TaxID=2998829 RepID=UPI0022CE32DF|nr:o-succinylbenzoate--CoA ligase [Vibrio sp. LaRot3]MDA0147910.1 o-succinylbenzoate--CoA ligase [Vibrio sp. LaRot3]